MVSRGSTWPGGTGKLIALVSAAVLLPSCGGGDASRAAAPPQAGAPPEVTVTALTPRTLANNIEVAGRLQAVRIAEVRARVDGIVQRRVYTEGSDVKAGQALFTIDPREMQAQLSAAQATLARAKATAANAQQVVNRYDGLVGLQAISQQEYDTAVAQLRTAQADVSQARAQVDAAELNLSYTTVRAAIAGRAGRAQVTEGALVSGSQATLLATIEQIDPIYANFSLSSSHLLEIRQQIAAGVLKIPAPNRVPIHLVLEDDSLYAETGRLNFLDLRIDETTGSAAIRGEFNNPSRSLLPGQFVRVRIEAGTRANQLLVPQRAVTVTPQGATVMLVASNDIVESREIQVGELRNDDWVVRSGLKPGDRVIVEGQQKVRAGQRVRSVARAPPSAQSAPAAASQPGRDASGASGAASDRR